MKLYTSEHVFFDHLDESTYVIGIGSIQEITKDYNLFSNLLKLSYFCIGGKSPEDIISYMNCENIDEIFLDKMLERNFLAKNNIDYNNRYSRNSLYYNVWGYDNIAVQNNIEKAHVLVVGAGGIGNIVSYLLSSIGIKKITLIDDDIIERSNLNRQFLFRENDISMRKVDVLKREITKINSDMEVDIFQSKLSSEILSKIKDIDLVISSADDEYCSEMMNDFCVKHKIPLITVGYLNDISIIGPFYIPFLKESCCLFCDHSVYLKNNIKDMMKTAIKKRKRAPSTVVNNFFSGAMLASELIKFFAKDYHKMVSLNHVVGIHNADFKLEKIEISKNENCIVCGNTHDKL